MTPVDVEAARELLADATPGPWRRLPNGVFGGDPERKLLSTGLCSQADATLAAAAPSLLAACLDEIEALRAEARLCTCPRLRPRGER